MKRDRIDVAALAQFERGIAVLRCVERSGGKDRWSHLFSHGHKYPTVRSLVRQGKLSEPSLYHYEITDAGRQCLEDVEIQKMRCA